MATPAKDSLDGRTSALADRPVSVIAAFPAAEADRQKMPHGGGALRKGAASGASNLAG